MSKAAKPSERGADGANHHDALVERRSFVSLADLGNDRRYHTRFETIDSNYALGLNKNIVYVDAGSGGVTVTLPTIADAAEGRLYYIYKFAGAGNVTITPDGSDLINGVNASKTLSTQWNGIQLIASEEHGWFATALAAA